MIDLIKNTIKNNWDKEIFVGIKIKHFFQKIMQIYNLLTLLKADNTTKVGIYAQNSTSWLAVYLASLLKGVTTVIVPPKMTEVDIKHYLELTTINYLFTDIDCPFLCSNRPNYILPLKIVFNIATLEVYRVNSTVKNSLLDLQVLASSKDFFNNYLPVYTKDTIDQLLPDLEYPNDAECVITPTLGTDYPEQKHVVYSSANIKRLIEEAGIVLPFNKNDTLQIDACFSRFHFIAALIPFIKGCILDMNFSSNYHYSICTTETFNKRWHRDVQPLLYSKIANYFLSKKSFYWLYSMLSISKLKKSYNSLDFKGVIVLNSELDEGKMNMLRNSNLQLYTTYGAQETPLVAINDYSTKILRRKNCAGVLLNNYRRKIHSGTKELVLLSNFMFSHYYGDPSWTDLTKTEDGYKTGDIALVDANHLFIYGRRNSAFLNSNNILMTSDEIERHINSFPFVKESIVFADNQQLYLSVNLDRNFLESQNMGLIEANKFLQEFLININTRFKSFTIKKINQTSKPFIKTFGNTIKKHLYRGNIKTLY